MASLHSQPQKRPGIKRIMTWSKSSKKHAHLFGYENAADDESQQPVPPSPTPSHKSVTTKSRPSLFHTFARRNSTKSESSRSRSPTSPRLSTEGVVDRTPSPTPSRNSMIFERDIEFHDSLSVHEAIDLGIPPVLDEFVQNDIPAIVENGDEAPGGSGENPWDDSPAEGAGPKPPLSLTIVDNRPPSPEPYEHPPAIADTLRVTTPKELKGLTANMFENPWK